MSGHELNNRIEYMVTCVGDFAAQHSMSPSEAYLFLDKYRGLAFLFKMFERGYYTLGEVLRRMRFQKKLTTQYSFHTRESLALLNFKEARNV